MDFLRCSRRFSRFDSALVVVLVALLLGGDGQRQAQACGWAAPMMSELTTFDPRVAGELADQGLEYDINTVGVGNRCEECERRSMRDDWRGYFGGRVADTDWEEALLRATPADLRALAASIASGQAPARLRPLFVTVQRQPTLETRVLWALEYVKMAREVEAVANLSESTSAVAKQALQAPLRQAAAAALGRRDPFLVQRYSFLRLRVTFYQRRWRDVEQLVATLPELSTPSNDLAWRSRYYLAGALRRTSDVAGANLELARIHAASKVLAGIAASDFQPQEDADWKAALQRAGDAQTRALLWRMVGLKFDGLAAAQEIFKLDPTSKLVALLVVRELAKSEAIDKVSDPAKLNAALEKLVVALATTPGADRPWLMDLIGGHLAAKRGDVAAARVRLKKAIAARPDDQQVRNQARASLAMALARQRKTDPGSLKELAELMLAQDTQFPNLRVVSSQVRALLAETVARKGQVIDAEFLSPASSKLPSTSWQDPTFLQRMLARTKQKHTAFDRFVLANSYTREGLELELGIYRLLHNQLAGAEQQLSVQTAGTLELNSDPFVTHIKDCVECDAGARRSDGKAWTLRDLSKRLNELKGRANGIGDPAAGAALELGTALYNLTLLGSARSIARDTHQASYDTSSAGYWYRRAYSLAKNRELKAQAAYLAAKAERGTLIAKRPVSTRLSEDLPLPVTWFSVVKTYADTAYHRQVLAECGAYRAWLAKH